MEKITGGKRILPADRRTLIYLFVFLAGVSIMLYPSISNLWNQHVFRTQVSSYEDEVDSGKVDTDAEMKAAKQYNRKLSPKEVPDAFSAKAEKTDSEYESVLDIGSDGMMGYVSIPSIDVELPIYHYTKDDVLKKGAGHLLGSSLPVGGKGTHAVISAHRGLPSAKMFTDLNLLQKGDVFYIHVLDKRLKYKVDRIEVVDPDETGSLGIEAGKDQVTLVTCTPYGVNTQRLLVRGQRTSDDAESGVSVRHDYTHIVMTVLCMIAGVALVYLVFRVFDRKRKRGENGTHNNT